MELVGQILKIVGSLGLFLYGMKVMSDGIQKAAGERLQSVMNFMTQNRFVALFTGFLITCLIQSSSATTVMVVSFVNAGLLSLTQSLGVIMGANIGTTITGWIVAILGFKFKISAIALPAIGIALPLLMIKRLNKRDLGEAIIGFGILFLGLSFLKGSVPDIKSNPEALAWLQNFSGPGFGPRLLFMMVGVVLTVIVQSSSATMAITLTMAAAGWIDFRIAAAMVLGENIGTTITAQLAALSANTSAKRAAMAHTLFNVIGVIWALILLNPLLTLIDRIVPGPIVGTGADLPTHIAMFHTLFNVTNSLIFIWLIPLLSKLIVKIVPEGEIETNGRYELKYISTTMQDTPELNIIKAKYEIAKMAEVLEKMFEKYTILRENPDSKMGSVVKELKDMEDYTDQMEEQISQYLVSCAQENLNDESKANVSNMIRIANELESIGDSFFNLVILAQKRYEKKIELEEDALKDYLPLCSTVHQFLVFIKDHLNEHLEEADMAKALYLEQKINELRNNLKKGARKRLETGANVRAELMFIDMIQQQEKVGDYLLNIAQALQEIQTPKATFSK